MNAAPVLDTDEIVINLDDGDLDIPLTALWSDDDVDAGLANFPDDLDFSFNFTTDSSVFTATIVGGGTTLRIRPRGSGLAFANLSAEDNRDRDFPNDPGNGLFNFSTNSRVTDDLPIRVNTTPFVDTPIPDVELDEGDPVEVLDLSLFFDDEDAGDSLTYRVVANSNPSLAEVNVNGEDLELTPEQAKRLLDRLKAMEREMKQARARARAGRKPVRRDWRSASASRSRRRSRSRSAPRHRSSARCHSLSLARCGSATSPA